MAGPGYLMIGDEERKEVSEVLESGYLSRYGSDDDSRFKRKVLKLEDTVAETIGVRYAFAVNSGTSALMAALKGLGVGPGVEVLVPGYTWVASIGAVVLLGGTPVLTEVDESLTMDPDDTVKKVTEHTKVILPVHILGYPANMDRLSSIANRHGLAILEDCCQSLGGEYRGNPLGSIGDAAAFSLNIFKTLTAGEGGFVTTNRREVYDRAYAFHDQGFMPRRRPIQKDDPLLVGMNMKINELTAAFCLGQMTKLRDIITSLRKKKQLFRETVAKGGIQNISFEALNDPGECCVATTAFFSDAATAEQVAKALGTRTLSGTGWHNYNNMDQLLAHVDESGQPLFERNSLPRTDDLLSRSVNVSIGVFNRGLGTEFGVSILSTEEEVVETAEQFVSIVKPIVDT